MNDLEKKETEEFDEKSGPEEIDAGEVYEDTEPAGKGRLPFWLGILVGIAVCAIAFTVLTFAALRKTSTSTDTDSGTSGYAEKAAQLMTYIDRYYLNEIDEAAIEEGVADGIMKALGDKYAEYYTAEEFADLMDSVSGSYAGIGVKIITNDDDEIEVYGVFSGSPAEEAGIIIGDLIVEAEGVSEFTTMDDLVARVRGEVGTTVDIVIERDGQRIPLTIERANIASETIAYELLDDNIGYIYIAEFDTVTVSQFNEAIEELQDQGMEALILDLRDNPGGDYDAVVAMADRVLPEGVIMTVKDKNGTIKTENSDAENRIDLPMAVLINGNSASASEVFTGAIQDYGIATIIGTQSYGKGIVQSIYKLPDGSGMKFTTQEYYTPSGDSINGVGITPDIVVELPEEAYDDGVITLEEDTQLQKAIEVLTK